MLLELRVDNLLIVESVCLEMGQGLSVITGETGAGKSLLLDALDLLLGRRADPALVGPKSDALTVSAVFAPCEELLISIADEHGIATEDGCLIVRRRVQRVGRSQAWVNDTPVSLKALRELAIKLVELRSQNEQILLANPSYQLRLLDRFGGIEDAAKRYAQSHRQVLDLQHELTTLETGDENSIRELEFARFQLQEIDALQPQEGEWELLEQRLEALSGVQEWRELSATAVQVLSESDQALIPEVARLAKQLAEAPYEDLRQAGQACIDAQEALTEVSRVCSVATDTLQSHPEELAEVEARIAAYLDVMRKHGGSESALLESWAQLSDRVAQIEGAGHRRERLRDLLSEATEQRKVLGAALAEKRLMASEKLAKRVAVELADLGMHKAQMSLESRSLAEPNAEDYTGQEIYLQTNPGLPAGPLGRVPSGGESSRLSLALTIALGGGDSSASVGDPLSQIPVMVFDEIDAGVGGRLGAALADKLHQLGENRTVLAISHTPQMAARAQNHYHVSKEQGADYTRVSVTALTGEERQREIAEMFGGGQEALKQAEVLLGDVL